MLKIKNLSYAYDKKFFALYNISIDLDNGAKILFYAEQELETQTLFRILAKQYKDYKGEILYNNKDLATLKMENLDMCYITKTPFLFNYKSVLYNICYPLIVRKQKYKNIKNVAQNLLEKYHYEYLMHKKIKHLSLKEKYIISLFRYAIRKTSILLCDDIFIDDEIIQLFLEINNSNITLLASKNKNFCLNNYTKHHFLGGTLANNNK